MTGDSTQHIPKLWIWRERWWYFTIYATVTTLFQFCCNISILYNSRPSLGFCQFHFFCNFMARVIGEYRRFYVTDRSNPRKSFIHRNSERTDFVNQTKANVGMKASAEAMYTIAQTCSTQAIVYPVSAILVLPATFKRHYRSAYFLSMQRACRYHRF